MLVVTLLAALGLLMAAGIHRGQFGSPDYAGNWLLIRLEVALVMSMIFLVLANLVLVFRGLFSRNVIARRKRHYLHTNSRQMRVVGVFMN